jgi:hypothetical protein
MVRIAGVPISQHNANPLMKIIRWTCVLYWVALTVGLLHPNCGHLSVTVPTFGPEWGSPRLDHFLAFFVLAVLVQAAKPRWGLVRLSAGLAAYAVLTEVAQAAVPNRTPAVLDAVSNLAGLVVGLVAWRLAEKFNILQKVRPRDVGQEPPRQEPPRQEPPLR